MSNLTGRKPTAKTIHREHKKDAEGVYCGDPHRATTFDRTASSTAWLDSHWLSGKRLQVCTLLVVEILFRCCSVRHSFPASSFAGGSWSKRPSVWRVISLVNSLLGHYLGSGAAGEVALVERGQDIRRNWARLPLVSKPGYCFASVRYPTLRGNTVSSRDRRRRISTAIRLVVHVWLHSIWLLRGAVHHSLHVARPWHGSILASAVAPGSSSPTTTAPGAGVRGLVNTNLPSVEPGGWLEPGNPTSKRQGMDSLDVVHRRNGFLGILFVAVSNETEASAAASVAVLNNDLTTCC